MNVEEELILKEELEDELRLIGSYTIKIINQIASIKSKITSERNWFNKILKDKDSGRIMKKIDKEKMNKNDLSLYYLVVDAISERVPEFIESLENYYQEVLQFEESFKKNRREALVEIDGLYNGTISEINFKEKERTDLKEANKIVFKKSEKSILDLSGKLFLRWGIEKNDIDFVIAQYMAEMRHRTGWERKGLITSLIKNIRKLNGKYPSVSYTKKMKELRRELKTLRKEIIRGSRSNKKWFVKCSLEYYKILNLRIKVESFYTEFYQKKYESIFYVVQKSHRRV